jgi:hypothetical protein
MRVKGYGGGNQRESDNLGDPGVDARVIIRWIFRMCDVGTDTGSSWLRISRGRRALVNGVMNLRVPDYAGNFLTSSKPVSLSRMTLLH